MKKTILLYKSSQKVEKQISQQKRTWELFELSIQEKILGNPSSGRRGFNSCLMTCKPRRRGIVVDWLLTGQHSPVNTYIHGNIRIFLHKKIFKRNFNGKNCSHFSHFYLILSGPLFFICKLSDSKCVFCCFFFFFFLIWFWRLRYTPADADYFERLQSFIKRDHFLEKRFLLKH